MSMTHEDTVLNPELRDIFDELQAFVHPAATGGAPLHEVELAIWKQVLGIGRHALQLFFNLLGNPCAPTIPSPLDPLFLPTHKKLR